MSSDPRVPASTPQSWLVPDVSRLENVTLGVVVVTEKSPTPLLGAPSKANPFDPGPSRKRRT